MSRNNLTQERREVVVSGAPVSSLDSLDNEITCLIARQLLKSDNHCAFIYVHE
jgi:hypothetical protein